MPLPGYAIENMVIERVRKAVREGQFEREVFTGVQGRLAEEGKRLGAEAKQIAERLKVLNAEGSKLAIAFQGPGAQFVEARIADLKGEFAALEVRLAEIVHRKKGLEGKEVELSWIAETLANFDLLWESMTLINRQRLVRSLIRRVEINEPAHSVNVSFWKQEDGIEEQREVGT